jgi:tRNA nucleotidyltransferase (CCA-adding enzyme)
MGGSGNRNYSPAKSLKELEEEKKNRLNHEIFLVDLNEEIQSIFEEINDRDVEGITKHLETITEALQKDIEGVINLKYGGSVLKNTYLAGISDVDMLVQINNSQLATAQPNEVLKLFKEQVEKRLPRTEVTVGDLAITVKFTTGHEIQLLPTVKTAQGYRIPKPGENRWSSVIKPE